MRAVRRVNTNMDKFMVNNADINDVDFDNMSMGHQEGCLDNSKIVSKKGINMMIILTIEVITGTVIIMLSLVEIWIQLN